jgi:two-component system nitrate/nitrite response regulator NarL
MTGAGEVAPSSAMSVLLVDDHPLVCRMLAALVRAIVPKATFATAHTLSAALQSANDCEPHLVLLDLGLPGCRDIEALSRFRITAPRSRIIVFFESSDKSTIHACICTGAAGYLPKTSAPEAVAAAIRFVLDGGVYVPYEALRHGHEGLTPRQVQVLGLMLDGLRNRHIAARLSISEGTVRQHVHAIFLVLGVSSRAQAMVVARQRDIGTGDME